MKFSGYLGYAFLEETAPDVFEEVYIEKKARGTFGRRSRNLQNGGEVNDTPSLNASITITADGYGLLNYMRIRYIKYNDALWKVDTVEVEYPRLILNVGGLYNAKKA